MNFNETRFAEAVELMQRLESGQTARDQRRSRRTSIRIHVDVQLDSANTDDWRSWELRDISPRGMRVVSEHAMEDGATFIVQFPPDADKAPPAPLICRVVHCLTRNDGTIIVGAEFIGRAETEANKTDDEEERIRKSILGK